MEFSMFFVVFVEWISFVGDKLEKGSEKVEFRRNNGFRLKMALRKGVITGMAGMATAYGVQSQKKAEAFGRKEDSYPPHGLSEGVKKLPQWIQLGCGNSEYVCKEKGATFTAENQPDQLPDLSKHNSFFADTMRNNPGLWDQYKDKQTSLGVTFAHCIKTGVDNKGKKANFLLK